MKPDDDPFGIPGDARPMCGVCFKRLSGVAHYTTVHTRNFGTQIVCAACVVHSAEKFIETLEAENARLRGEVSALETSYGRACTLLYPFAEWFAEDCEARNDHDSLDRSKWTQQFTYGHMREVCREVGVDVKTGGTSDA